MSSEPEIRHAVAIAGSVQDKVSKVRIAHAWIEITSGPPAFQTMRQAQAADPTWQQRPERIDRTRSQTDGIFYFVDLPPGDYRLRITTPHLGTQYGKVETAALQVPARPEGQPVQFARIDIELPPTRIHGTITAQGSGEAVARAKVRMRGDTRLVFTQDDGSYELTRLVAGKPTIEVTAAKFESARQLVSLDAGQDEIVNLQLKPKSTTTG